MERLRVITKAVAPIFKNMGRKMLYKKHQLFVRPEDSAQGIYYLDQGQAMICSSKPEGLDQLIGFWEEGAIFGKVGSVMSQPHTVISIEALTDCVVYRLSQEDFHLALQQRPAAQAAYMGQVSYNNIFFESSSYPG